MPPLGGVRAQRRRISATTDRVPTPGPSVEDLRHWLQSSMAIVDMSALRTFPKSSCWRSKGRPTLSSGILPDAVGAQDAAAAAEAEEYANQKSPRFAILWTA